MPGAAAVSTTAEEGKVGGTSAREWASVTPPQGVGVAVGVLVGRLDSDHRPNWWEGFVPAVLNQPPTASAVPYCASADTELFVPEPRVRQWLPSQAAM